MRLSSIVPTLLVFCLAAVLSGIGARAAVGIVEDRSVISVREALTDEELTWVDVLGDGLQIILEGEAPSEAVRFRAMTVAGTQVDASRVIDNMSVQETEGLAPPDFAIEILRNDTGISLIGLIPASTDRTALATRIAEIAGNQPVTDLMEIADYPVPGGWRRSMDYAIGALADLPRAKISVTAGRVQITAMADSPEAKQRLETALARRVPDEVRLSLEVSAPRPVISPFIARFTLDEEGARFDACSADSGAAQRTISEAASAAGFEGKVSCPIGLGVPSGRWGEVVALSIGAVDALGGGTVTVSDADITLVAAMGTPEDRFDRVVGELGNDLPDLFSLEASLPTPPEETDEDEVPRFTVTRSPEGDVQLRGQVGDALLNTTAENYARARFADSDITMGTRITEGLPEGWTIRVLAGIEALSHLASGSVEVLPDSVTVRGLTGSQQARSEISRVLVDKLGQGAEFEIDVTYREALDPIAALPTPEECIQQITAVTSERKITFDPGSADIAGPSQTVVDDIAEILRRCADLRIEVAGYTDSQGREEMNERLSQDRAEAVLSALRLRRVPVGTFRAVGYGEADPIADNETEEGREANRRIEFWLITPESEAADESGEAGDDAEADGDSAAADEDDSAGDDAAEEDAAEAGADGGESDEQE